MDALDLREMGKKSKKRKSLTQKNKKLSKSYIRFEQTVKRSLNLMSLQDAVEQVFMVQGAGEVDPGDLTRAAVVLSVAAMDAYFTDVFAENFIPYLKKRGPSERICKILNDAGLTTKVALNLLSMERPYRRIQTLVEQFFERQTTQRAETVDNLFLSYGLKNFSQNVQKLKRRKTLLRSVQIIVERRHKIAHDGDLNAHGRLNPIDHKKVKRRIMDIVTYVAGAEEILQKKV